MDATLLTSNIGSVEDPRRAVCMFDETQRGRTGGRRGNFARRRLPSDLQCVTFAEIGCCWQCERQNQKSRLPAGIPPAAHRGSQFTVARL